MILCPRFSILNSNEKDFHHETLPAEIGLAAFTLSVPAFFPVPERQTSGMNDCAVAVLASHCIHPGAVWFYVDILEQPRGSS